MKHELCSTCKPYGECQFEAYAKTIADSVPPLKKQTRISQDPNIKATQEALEASNSIARLRIIAREQICPKINQVNPNYPGKRNL